MNNRTMGAGSGPQFLARARRQRSSLLKFIGMGLLAAPIPAVIFWNTFPLWAYILLLIAARICYYLYSHDDLHSARRAERGAQAEIAVATKLSKLPPGWKCEAGIYFAGFGDIDLFVSSPKGRAFVIDVKSHWGEVTLASDGSRLMRVLDGSLTEFEKDILKGVRGQAYRMSKERNIPFVIPVLAFSKAKVLCETSRINNVWVVEETDLLALLEEIESQPLTDYHTNKANKLDAA